MPLGFDDDVAERLIVAARASSALLRDQGSGRRQAVETALRGFVGGYATLFAEASRVEAEDRYALANALDELSDQVRVAQLRAADELARRRQLHEWSQLEAERTLERRTVDSYLPGAYTSVTVTSVLERPPSLFPIAPPTITAVFLPRERERTVSPPPLYAHSRSLAGSSGADPESLRIFASRMNALNAAVAYSLNRFRFAWATFHTRCTWVPIDRATLSSGFADYLRENTSDAVWVRRIADAFDAAGRGTLPDFRVTIAVAKDQPALLLSLLLGGTLPHGRNAATWVALSRSTRGNTETLVRRYANVLGAMDGLPASVRVQANRFRAPQLIADASADLEAIRAGEAPGDREQMAYLENEITYLRGVERGDVQLYLYDRDRSRVIEMVGSPTPKTERVVTYVPGTFTGLNSFFTGEVQQVAQHLTASLPETLAFVYKDGLFPGEEPRTTAPPSMLRVTEANDPDFARASGVKLAEFQRALHTDLTFNGTERIAVGHSWGLANVAASEVSGARYDTVVSLSGAAMLREWEPTPKTEYFDLSYDDLLQRVEREGYVRGQIPRQTKAFTSVPYFSGADDQILDESSVKSMPGQLSVLLENHSLIATSDPDNQDVLDEIVRNIDK